MPLVVIERARTTKSKLPPPPYAPESGRHTFLCNYSNNLKG